MNVEEKYFTNKFTNISTNPKNLEKEFLKFMKMMKPVFLGLVEMSKNKLVHKDINIIILLFIKIHLNILILDYQVILKINMNLKKEHNVNFQHLVCIHGILSNIYLIIKQIMN